MKTIPTPLALTHFHQPDSLKDCKAMSDKSIGGYTQAQMDWVPPSAENENGYMKFYGTISTKLPPDKPEVHRIGYAAWRTLDQGYSIFGKSIWDIDPFTHLALRIKSDGRSYQVNLQTESIIPTDLHQHRLYTRKPGQWETVLIGWNDFVRTNHGAVAEPQSELLRQKVKTVGIGATDGKPGKFEICVERIWATSELTAEELAEDGREEQGQLKSVHGMKLGARRPFIKEKTRDNPLAKVGAEAKESRQIEDFREFAFG